MRVWRTALMVGGIMALAGQAQAVPTVWEFNGQVSATTGTAPAIASGTGVRVEMRFDPDAFTTGAQGSSTVIYVGVDFDIEFDDPDNSFVREIGGYIAIRNDTSVDAFAMDDCAPCSFNPTNNTAPVLGGAFAPLAQFYRGTSVPLFDHSATVFSSTDFPSSIIDPADFNVTTSSVIFDIDPNDGGIFESVVRFTLSTSQELEADGGDVPAPAGLGLLLLGLGLLTVRRATA